MLLLLLQHQRRRSSSGSSSRGRLLLLLLLLLGWRGRIGRRRLRIDVIAEEVLLVGHGEARRREKKEEQKKQVEDFLSPPALKKKTQVTELLEIPMSSLFADVLGTAAALGTEPSAAAALFSASSAFKRDAAAAAAAKESKKNKKGARTGALAGGDAVGKHAASRRRRQRTKKEEGDGSDDDEGEQLDLLRSQAEAAAQAAAAAREHEEGGGNSDDGFDSSSESDSEDDKGSEEEEDELERLAALSDSEREEEEEEEGEEEDAPLGPQTPTAAHHTSLNPEQQLERLSRTVFVGNVSPTSKRKFLKRVFSEFGKVESVRLRSVPLAKGTLLPRRAALLARKADASRSGGACAYVVFEERAAAERALSKNMEEVGGNVVRVDFAAPPSSRGKEGGSGGSAAAAPSSSPSSPTNPLSPSLYDPALSVFVGNLPPDAEEAELVALFGGKNAVAAVRVVRDPTTSLGKGFAFVLLRDSAAAAAARARDGMLLKGRPVRVRKAARDPAALAAAKQRREEKARSNGSTICAGTSTAR